MNSPVPAKTALHQAINELERWQNRLDCLPAMTEGTQPHAALALRIALQSAVERGRRTCLVSETFSPAQAALRMMCLLARVPIEETRRRKLEQPEFTRLTWATARISASSVMFVSAGTPNQAAGHLVALDKSQGLDTVVCERKSDADLEDWQENLALVSKVSGVQVHLINGELPAAGRFIHPFGQRA